MMMIEGSASIVVNRPVGEVFDAIADITRMGEWSPECIAGRWVGDVPGPSVGAKFEGDNVAKLGPITLKRWTTTSEVTEFVPNQVFEFSAEGYTTWRYEFADREGGTELSESFSYPQYTGWQKFVYSTLARRSAGMVKGIEQTLARVKQRLEAS